MVNGIRTVYPRGLNKGFAQKFRVGYQIQQEISEEVWWAHQTKHCEYNDKDENNCPNILNNKDYQASSQNFQEIRI